MKKIFLSLLFFSFIINATSIVTLEKTKFVEDSTLDLVSVRVSSDYFSVITLAQQTGIIQDVTFDKILYQNFSATVHELEYYLSTALVGILTVTYTTPSSWDMEWWDSETLLLESGDKVLLESGYELILEKNSV